MRYLALHLVGGQSLYAALEDAQCDRVIASICDSWEKADTAGLLPVQTADATHYVRMADLSWITVRDTPEEGM